MEKKKKEKKRKGNLDISQSQSNWWSCFVKHFSKRLRLHLRSRSTRGAGAVFQGAGALPNGPLPLSLADTSMQSASALLFDPPEPPNFSLVDLTSRKILLLETDMNRTQRLEDLELVDPSATDKSP